MGWPEEGNTVNITSLNSGELMLAEGSMTGYLLTRTDEKEVSFVQDKTGLKVNLPEEKEDEMAYVLKFVFEEGIPDGVKH